MKGPLKAGIGVALVAAVGAVLLVAAEGARDRGRLTWCRNNLRKLGEMAHQKLLTEDSRESSGRRFWQEVRQEHYTTVRQGVETWIIRQGGVNPFGCPVRGVQPLDLSTLTQPELERHMSDPLTIDYRGPKVAPPADSKRAEVIGGDLEGNHGGRGGYVLLIDQSVMDARKSLQFQTFHEAGNVADALAE